MAGKEDRSGATTQIVVALIGVTGVIGAAIFANWDKIIGQDPPPGSERQLLPTAINMAPIPANEAPTSEQQSPSPVDDAARSLVSPEISGAWYDNDGFVYNIDQRGSSFSYTQTKNGMEVGNGSGTILGRSLNYGFIYGTDRGVCETEVEPGDRAMAGRCRIGVNAWPVRFTR